MKEQPSFTKCFVWCAYFDVKTNVSESEMWMGGIESLTSSEIDQNLRIDDIKVTKDRTL